MYKKLIVKEVTENVKGFKTFTFDAFPDVNYLPGQYLTLIDFANGQEIRRSYSIISTPVLKEPLSIGVKRIQNGFFSRRLIDNVVPGNELLSSGAGGLFILPENIAELKQVFFLAAGSGITPVFSLLKTVLYAHPHLLVILIYSNSSAETAIFLNDIRSLKEIFPKRLVTEFLYSNSPDLRKAHLHRDLLMQIIIANINSGESTCLFYICGPEAYMRMCTYTLHEMGFVKDNIKRENFVIQKAAANKLQPPDKSSYMVTINTLGNQYNFAVHYPDSILRAAKKNGILLPYSCEAGSCGNCIAKLKQGQVWLSHNEVLNDVEINRGLTLTCVGHPVGGDVILEIG